MAVNLKLGVELGDFQQNINQAKAQIKEFDAALKQAESRFKATGDAESAMATKTSQLTAKLQAQKKMVDEYRAALQKADENGVSKLNAEYIKLQTQMLNAEAAMYDTQTALNGLTASEKDAAAGADALTKSVNGIGKKISLDQVIGGIDKITGGLENAARRAVDLGQKLWDMIMDSAQRASDQATVAEMYDIPLQRYKQMLGLEAEGLKTTTDAILSSQKKLNANIGKGSTETLNTLRELGLLYESGKGVETFVTEDTVEMFWLAGQAMLKMGEGFDKESKSMSLFGKGWNELVPLFRQYKSLEEYEAALSQVDVTSEETTKNLDELADEVGKLQNTWTTLKDEIIGQVAPGLTDAAGALNSVLSTVLEYLQKEEGQQMLQKLGDSVAGLFDDLSKVNPEDVVSNFVTVFDKLTSGLEFLANNWEEVKKGLLAIGGAFATLKIAEGVLEFVKLISGLRGLGAGGGSAASAITSTFMDSAEKLAFSGVESTLGTSIGGAIASVLTSTPLTVAIATASIVAIAHGVHEAFTAETITDKIEEGLIEAGNTPEEAKAKAEAMDQAAKHEILTNPSARKKATDLLKKGLTTGDWTVEPVPVAVAPKTNEEAAAEISEQIGTVPVTVVPVVGGTGSSGPSYGGAAGGGGGLADYWYEQEFGGFRPGYANGIPWVPDTRLAWLHPGERVLTASQNRSYTANSNLYIENMHMGGGMDARALADAMSAENRRISAGFGS